jgi:predicted nucleic acid-binding protein
MMLAALAGQSQLIVLTSDQDFEVLTDLAIENWIV